MKAYETFRNSASVGKKLARIGFVAGTLLAVPYICNDGCAYSSGCARAAERQKVTSPAEAIENLEIILTK